jgi:hypothetical protein
MMIREFWKIIDGAISTFQAWRRMWALDHLTEQHISFKCNKGTVSSYCDDWGSLGRLLDLNSIVTSPGLIVRDCTVNGYWGVSLILSISDAILAQKILSLISHDQPNIIYWIPTCNREFSIPFAIDVV